MKEIDAGLEALEECKLAIKDARAALAGLRSLTAKQGEQESVAKRSEATEDVLIDGIAYTVPVEVACELLRLHLEKREPVAREHISSAECWCCPELDYVDPLTGSEVWIHKEPQ